MPYLLASIMDEALNGLPFISMVPMEASSDPISTAIEKVPGIIDKVSGFMNKKKADKAGSVDEAVEAAEAVLEGSKNQKK